MYGIIYVKRKRLEAYLPSPIIKDILSVELEPEGVPITLQLLALDVTLPALAQHILHSPHVRCQLPVNLLGPDDGTRDRRQVPHCAHAATLALRILDLEMQHTVRRLVTSDH